MAALRLEHDRSATASVATAVAATFSAGAVLGAAVTQRVVPRLSRRRVLLSSAALSVLGLAAMLATGSIIASCAALFVLGVSCAPHHPLAAQKGTAGPYRLTEINLTYRIDGQQDRRFWGTMSSENFSNRLIGSQSMNGKWLYMAGAEGLVDGQVVDADTIEVCYRHANAASATVGCNLMKRQK